MHSITPNDPYAGNLLTAGLGPLRSRLDVMTQLLELPPLPRSTLQSASCVLPPGLFELLEMPAWLLCCQRVKDNYCIS